MNPSRIATCWTICILLATNAVHSFAQSQEKSSSKLIPTQGLTIVSLTVSPLSRVIPNAILPIRCEVKNNGDQAATGYLVGRIQGQTGEEDRRRVELAAGEQKQFEVPLRLGSQLPSKSIEVLMTMNVMEGDSEVMLTHDDSSVTRTLQLNIAEDRNITATVMDRDPERQAYWRWPPTEPNYSYEMTIGSRVDATLSRQCVVLENEPLPQNAAQWQAINTLVISSPRMFDDAANIAMVQRFLHGGGRVWVMLDTIDTDLVASLLTESQQIETIETVELNQFAVQTFAQQFSLEDRSLDYPNAVSMKRVIQHGGKVTQEVDGWPAAIWMNVGRGELLLTTLDSSSWLRQRKTHANPNPAYQSSFSMHVWATALAHQVHSANAAKPASLSESTYPVDRIGNPVVSRSIVSAVLLGFCLSLIMLGAWRMLRGQLNWLGALVPLLAVCASTPLIIASFMQRREIPPMVSSLQFVQIGAETGTHLQETAAVYSSEPRSMQLAAAGDGIAIPSEQIESGIRCLTTDDFHRWSLNNPSWPAGTWRYRSSMDLPEKQVFAEAKLTSDGLSIQLPKDLPGSFEDPVVNMVPGAPSLGKVIDGSQLLVNGELAAEGERWTVDTIVTDEQRRRSKVYSQLFEAEDAPKTPDRLLYGWTDLWPQAPAWDTELEKRGAALVTMPIRLLTPPLGTQVRIPFSLIRIEHADPKNASSIFKQATGEFISESTLSTQCDLAFLLPPETVPLDVSSLSIDWDIRAPKRTAKLSAVVEGQPIELTSIAAPSIPWKDSVTDPRVLSAMRNGRLILRIEITGGEQLEDSSGFISWRIKHLRINVEGRTAARNNLVAASSD